MFAHLNKQYPDYHFRLQEEGDYHCGLFETLAQLTNAPKPTYQRYLQHLQRMRTSRQKHVHVVGIDKQTGKVIAAGSLIVCGSPTGRLGKIENIVACKSVRGKGLGRCIIELLKAVSWEEQCSKVSLFCTNSNVEFYKKLGFSAVGTIYVSQKQ